MKPILKLCARFESFTSVKIQVSYHITNWRRVPHDHDLNIETLHFWINSMQTSVGAGRV